MTRTSPRRILAVLSLAAALFVLPAAESRAAQHRKPGKSGVVRVEARSRSLWSFVTGIWQAAGGRIDDNGLLSKLVSMAGGRIDDNG